MNIMKYEKKDFMRIFRIMTTAVAAFVVLSVSSCTKVTDVTYAEVENRSLKAWMANHHPELLENFQEDGAYYVEILAVGNPDSVALKDVLVEDETSSDDDPEPGCWVSLKITGRDLEGKVCVTRDEMMARMQGTFTKYTHYVPYMSYMGATSASMVEGSYLAMKNSIKLGNDYAASLGLGSASFDVRYGTKLRLYLPSSITSGSGLAGDGGYEGEYSLDSNRPVIMEVEVVDRINNPVSYEAYMVDGFGLEHGGISPLKEIVEDDKDGDSSDEDEDDEEEEEEEEDDGLYWRHACDTIPGLIVTKRYNPGDLLFKYEFPFTVDADEETGEGGKSVLSKSYRDTEIYADMNTLEEKINEALKERFGEGRFDGEKVGTDGTASIWYITRFMDGFIIDSNIKEVRELVFGTEEDSERSVFSYSPESDKDDTVTAWYYTVPHMRYGGWYTVATTSTFAYGYSGQTGSSSTSSSSSSLYPYYYNPYMMYNGYMNSYYGSSYYDYYYYNMYNSYYNNMYYNDTTSESKTTIYTEIQPYTPLIFQMYVEEK